MALIIFDIDGTLLQTHLVTIPAVQQVFEEFNLIAPTEERIWATFGAPVEEYEEWLASHAPGREGDVVEATNERELALIGEAGELYPGTLDILAGLRDAGHALASCSNGSVPYVNEAIDAHNLRPLLPVVRCIGQGYENKAAMIGDILACMDARPAIVVGDRSGDVTGAHANSALAVGAAYGFGGPGELDDADVRIGAITELPEAIAHLLAR
ncbi:MAG: HAD family hydrolase [bacterium]|nr:HAD family hydrolase [bacterium]